MISVIASGFGKTAGGEELTIFYKGIRPLGMGGAFTAVADDENALFYNPAGLNGIEGFGGAGILNPYFESGNNTLDFILDVSDIADAEDDTEAAALAADILEKYLGEHLHLRTGVFPNFTMHNFGFGILGQAVFDGEVHNPLGVNTLDVTGGYDIALVVSGAYGFEIGEGSLAIGATGKAVHRQVLEERYTTRELVEEDGIDLREDLEKGTGIGIDLGAIYSPPVFLNPAFGLTVQNLGDTSLGDAGKLKQQVNLGAALQPRIAFGNVLFALDIIDITRNLGADDDFAKRLNLGVEYRLPLILSVRSGFHQGYWGGGLTLDFDLLRLEYAYYVEEVGAFAGQRPDHRHMIQLTLGL